MHILRLIIPFNTVSKKNRLRPLPLYLKKGKLSLWQFKGRFVRVILKADKTFLDWERDVQKWVKSQLPPEWELINYPVEAHEIFHYKGNEPDTSGHFESLADALEGIVWENDKYLKRIFADKVKDKGNPHVELLIEEIS